MTVLELIFTTIGGVISVAALFAGIGYFKQGSNQETIDGQQSQLNTNSLLKDQVNSLEDKVNRQSQQITDLSEKVETLTKEIEIKDMKLAEALAILQDKNPQMTEFLQSMESYVRAAQPVIDAVKTQIVPTVERLSKFLDKQSF